MPATSRPRVVYAELRTHRPQRWIMSLTALGFRHTGQVTGSARTTNTFQHPNLTVTVSSPSRAPASVAPGDTPGERIADLAIAVDDVPYTLRCAAQAGMSAAGQPAVHRTRTGQARYHTAITGAGAVRHPLLQGDRGPASRLPATADHVAFVLPQPQLAATARAYAQAFGLHAVMLPFAGPYTDLAEAWYLQGPGVRLIFLAPAPGATGELTRFLHNHGPGIHHLALPADGNTHGGEPALVTPIGSGDAGFALELIPPIRLPQPDAHHPCSLLPLVTFSPNDHN